jgi:ribosomal protein L40E
MSAEADQARAARQRKAEEIARDPSNYKVCEGCESIVATRAATCPNCHGYRFNEDGAVVVEQARLLGSRDRTSVIAEDLW